MLVFKVRTKSNTFSAICFGSDLLCISFPERIWTEANHFLEEGLMITVDFHSTTAEKPNHSRNLKIKEKIIVLDKFND